MCVYVCVCVCVLLVVQNHPAMTDNTQQEDRAGCNSICFHSMLVAMQTLIFPSSGHTGRTGKVGREEGERQTQSWTRCCPRSLC